jgi:hypothetical protein
LLFLQKAFKILFVVSFSAAAILYFLKDELPPASFYDLENLGEPLQEPTREEAFLTQVSGEKYLITPRFDYQLDGVVVSYNNSGDFSDYFHRYWNDYLNLRDLCVIWGDNGKWARFSTRNRSPTTTY